MKRFKEVRQQVSEEYYSGPTAYAGGDTTNVGDIAQDQPNMAAKKTWVKSSVV